MRQKSWRLKRIIILLNGAILLNECYKYTHEPTEIMSPL